MTTTRTGTKPAAKEYDRAAMADLAPMLRPEWESAVLEPSCADIDVAALHAAYLRTARKHGTNVATDARVSGAPFSAGFSTDSTARNVL